jgi:predicted transcriptional regulator
MIPEIKLKIKPLNKAGLVTGKNKAEYRLTRVGSKEAK